jgi:hypothetical protein
LLKHYFDRQGAVVLLASLLSMDENGFRLDKRAWDAARVLSVAKSLSLEILDERGSLLFVYLIDGLDPTVTAEMQHLRYSSVIGRIKDVIEL